MLRKHGMEYVYATFEPRLVEPETDSELIPNRFQPNKIEDYEQHNEETNLTKHYIKLSIYA